MVTKNFKRIYEWDEEKREKNIIVHGVDFIDCIEVFEDDINLQYRYDVVSSNFEDRFQAVGLYKYTVLFIVYTERVISSGIETYRIISARRANKKETKQYNNHTFEYV